jgi:beta-lactamase class A
VDFSSNIEEIEKANGGRLGVCLIDTATNRRLSHRGDERFAMCSTHKALTAGFVLQRVDNGEESLDRRVSYDRSSLVAYSPATEKHVGEGMTIGALCVAAVTLSDNTAANLLLLTLGGPEGFTARARALGDGITRLDRIETKLNEATPDDPRDTTTPNAFADNLSKFAVGNALSVKSREQFAAWLIANRTGSKRLRAGLPPDWRVGDKTGSGEHGTGNDVAVIWPPGRAPLIVAAYYTESSGGDDVRAHVLAEVGRRVAML